MVLRIAVAALTLLPLTYAGLPNMAGTQWKTRLFADDFKGKNGALPSSKLWLIDTGTSYPNGPAQWGTGEIETYTNSPANVHLNGYSSLYIVPLRSSSGAWTSARIETVQSNFVAPVSGKMLIQASIRMPQVTPTNGLGYWPAFWTLGSRYGQGWPMVGEYDIMENVNALNSYNSGLHCGVYTNTSGGQCNEPEGLTMREPCPGSNCNGNFHTFGVIVDRSTNPETLSFYVDGSMVNQVSESAVNETTWDAAVHHGHVVLLNVAMGGAYPNGVSGQTTPTSATVSGKEMRVDYVGVWTT